MLLVCGEFPPMRSSGAVQLRDLAREFVREGHSLTCLVASVGSIGTAVRRHLEGYETVHIGIPNPKVANRFRRVAAEFFSPYILIRAVRRELAEFTGYDCVIWYSPTIFLGPVVKYLKKINCCKGYLIIRDIFPEWALDIGLMGPGLPYKFFKYIANQQYEQADIIGVQSQGNLAYFEQWQSGHPERRVEVLQNWLANTNDVACSITVAGTPLAGRTIFVYAGNMGVAQNMDILIDLSERLLHRQDIGFLFVGRGTEAQRLHDMVKERKLNNVAFFDEIDSREIPGLYAQCHVGIVALDPRHKTHNIPGKFLSYMQSGLPVLACINDGNDLVHLIQQEHVGRVCIDHSLNALQTMVEDIASELTSEQRVDATTSMRCKALSSRLFSPSTAVKQIVQSLQKDRS